MNEESREKVLGQTPFSFTHFSISKPRVTRCYQTPSSCNVESMCSEGNLSSIGNGGTSAFLDGANSLPIVLFKKWGKSLGIKMEFFETALDLD